MRPFLSFKRASLRSSGYGAIPIEDIQRDIVMGVRLKVLLSIVVVFALLAVTASYVLGFAIYGGLARLEREDMQSYAKQLVEAVREVREKFAKSGRRRRS